MIRIRLLCTGLAVFSTVLGCSVIEQQSTFHFSKKMLSGLWHNVSKEIPKGATIQRAVNCEINLKDSIYTIKPSSPGTCSVILQKKNAVKVLTWVVDEAPPPMPTLNINRPYKDFMPDWSDPRSYVIRPIMNIPYDKNAEFENTHYACIYSPEDAYKVVRFSLNFMNSKDSLLYSSYNLGNQFSCADFDAYTKYSQEKGNKMIIYDVDIIYPDFITSNTFAMDTIRF